MTNTQERISRAQGCLLGQLAGDSLGSLVEFRNAESIKRQYPEGIRDMLELAEKLVSTPAVPIR